MTETKNFELTPKQREAAEIVKGPAQNILLRGGSRSGKSALLAYATLCRAIQVPGSRHGIFRREAKACHDALFDLTVPQIMRLAWPGLYERCRVNHTDLTIELPNGKDGMPGSVLLFGGLDANRLDRILGQEYATIWMNEATEFTYDHVETLLSRLSQKILVPGTDSELRTKLFVDLNPEGTKHFSYQAWILKLKPGSNEPLDDPDDWQTFQLNPHDNAANIASKVLKTLENFKAERRRRFLLGEWTAVVDGALFKLADIDVHRVGEAPDLKRVVVAVDPPVTSGEKADECGIVVVGLGLDDRAYVLADRTCKGLTPEGWARVAVQAYRDFEADRVIAEVNNGGELVEAVLRQIDPTISYKAVRASKGKVTRAEPVSSLYEQGRVSHVGTMPELEDQLCALVPGFDSRRAGWSPDRADALVWGLTDLMLKRGGSMSIGKQVW